MMMMLMYCKTLRISIKYSHQTVSDRPENTSHVKKFKLNGGQTSNLFWSEAYKYLKQA